MLKKIIAKLILMSLVSMAISFAMPQAYAEDPPPAQPDPENKLNDTLSIGEALADVEKQPCIQEFTDKDGNVGAKGPDEGYIITIIEEPLNPKPVGKTPGDDYVSRICYRNYFSFTPAKSKNEETSTVLARDITDASGKVTQSGCSANAAKLIQNQELKNKHNIKFTCQQVQVLLTKGGTSAIEGYINTIYRWAASVIGLIAVAVIIFSAIQISFAGGDSTGVDEAKKRIIQSLLAVALLFLSGVILNFVNPTFFVK